MEKIYKVQMNSKGAPDFSTAVEIPSSDNHDWEKYSDKLWKNAYERGKADSSQEWIPCKERLPREYEVLCCDIYRNCIVGHPFADDSVSTGFCAESEGEFLYECVAWMPLPDSWKGEDDGEDIQSTDE